MLEVSFFSNKQLSLTEKLLSKIYKWDIIIMDKYSSFWQILGCFFRDTFWHD